VEKGVQEILRSIKLQVFLSIPEYPEYPEYSKDVKDSKLAFLYSTGDKLLWIFETLTF
jgi:hypothetical protein